MKFKNIFLSLGLCVCFGGAAQVNVKSGLTVGGGGSKLSGIQYNNVADVNIVDFQNPDVAVGYRFRIQPSRSRFLYDIDLAAGLKRYKHTQYRLRDRSETDLFPLDISIRDHTYLNLTLAPACSYRFVDKWYAGAGINPTVYWMKGRTNDNRNSTYRFDMPVALKLGYDFHYVDVSFNYHIGLFNTSDSDSMKKAKMQSWQIQAFIPF